MIFSVFMAMTIVNGSEYFSLPLTIVIAIKSKLMYVLMDSNITVVLHKFIVCM